MLYPSRILAHPRILMPKPPKTYVAVAKYPADYVIFSIGTGMQLSLPVFFEQDNSDRELIQCDRCARYVPLTSQRSTINLQSHRGSKGCNMMVQKKEEQQVIAETNAAADTVIQKLFPQQDVGE